jgi:ubiquinone/menaquinone biosynthesis C-methylase UbiE
MLSKNQYSTADKYKARIALTTRFRTNPESRMKWVFDHFPQKENLRVLELGSGTGLFWLANRERIPASWDIVLSDYSEGMLSECKKALSNIRRNFSYLVVTLRK